MNLQHHGAKSYLLNLKTEGNSMGEYLKYKMLEFLY